jgi:hypothetical protein
VTTLLEARKSFGSCFQERTFFFFEKRKQEAFALALAWAAMLAGA